MDKDDVIADEEVQQRLHDEVVERSEDHPPILLSVDPPKINKHSFHKVFVLSLPLSLLPLSLLPSQSMF